RARDVYGCGLDYW
nr:immunoglobulin heavy chain junction region [Macaca mulatta]